MPRNPASTAPLPDESGIVRTRGTRPTLDDEAASRSPKAPSSGLDLPDRYEDLRLIGTGGFSEVRRIFDKKLGRAVAIKILRPDRMLSPELRARFLAEIQLTARLQHPGIVPVHDYGEFEDGRLWFTMAEVEGRTFRAVIAEAYHRAQGHLDHRSNRRLLEIFRRVCETVAYAHHRSVIHRDLKPENVMVGKLGEVMVMDWGIARHPDDRLQRLEEPGIEATAPKASEEHLTQYGDVLGTPAYMPPEQAMGDVDKHGPATDVYALGAMLFHVLVGHAPAAWPGLRGSEALRQELEENPGAPPELIALCVRAMAQAPEERYADASELAAEFSVFLDGARRRETALEELEAAMVRERELEASHVKAEALRRAAKQAQLGVRPFDGLDDKLPGWTLEDEAEALEREVALQEAEWIQAIHQALAVDPALPEAHAVLADHYREKLLDAELGRRHAEAARFEVLLRAHDRGKYATFLRGEGALSLVSDPPGAEVELFQYVARERRLLPKLVRRLGRTPLHAVELPRGSYLLRLRAPGRAEVSYPVLIERAEHWDGRAPGQDEPYAIPLPRKDELGPEDVYVPAGYCWTGGDPEAADSLPRRRIWVDGFVLRRFPITNREFIDFLNRLCRGELGSIDLGYPPSQPGLLESMSGHPTIARDEDGRFALRTEGPNEPWEPEWPAVADWYAASAYARWLAAHTGAPWRLPNEFEREKAARGVDGRLYPWGDHVDPIFACVLEGHRATPMPEQVDGHPMDESPYGVRGLAGNLRDWCINIWKHEGPPLEAGRLSLDPAPAEDTDFRVIKGGAWGSAMNGSRSAARFGFRPASRSLSVGFRLTRPYPAKQGITRP